MASKNEKRAKELGISLQEYKNSDEYKSKKKDDKKSSGGNEYKDIVDSILKNTPAQQEVLPTFDEVYSGNILDKSGIERIKKLRPDVVRAYGNDEKKIQDWWNKYGKNEMPNEIGRLEKEDYAQSEALYKPYFQQQIANELEDLNAWSEAESVNYERSLRRARISISAQGGAIGSERENMEGEMETDRNAERNNTLREYERNIGTNRLNKAGYQSGGQKQEGALVGKMKEAIQEGQLWYKNQRAQRYYGNAQTYYSQPSAYSLAGTEL